MSKVLISLTPTGKFYFGGDMSFRVNNQDEKNAYSSYIIESNYFPQQTSLLGMLRFLILSLNEEAFDKDTQRIRNHTRAAQLIGSHSFRLNQEHAANDFGVIQSLSQVFLQIRENEDWSDLQVAPKDYDYGKDLFSVFQEAYMNGQPMDVPALPDYSAKKHQERRYINSAGKAFGISEIFIKDQRIGIDRDIRSGKTKEDALFKQVNYRLNDQEGYQFRFAFYADLDLSEAQLAAMNNRLVSLGGDSSHFILHMEAVDTLVKQPYGENYDLTHKVVLLSPASIDRTALDKTVRFALSDTIPFRFMTTTVETKSYNRLSGEVQTSEKMYLYQTGSVFYFKGMEEMNAFVQHLESKEDFRQIGYNQFMSQE